MKKFYRRSISGLLALLICFTTILGSSVTALATSVPAETAKSYSVAFPRNGDANLDTSGTWGHDELHYMNGWTSGEKTWMTTLHTIGDFNGRPVIALNRAYPVCWKELTPAMAKIIGRTTHPSATVPLMSIRSRRCWDGSCSTVIRAICLSAGVHRIMQMPTSWRT